MVTVLAENTETHIFSAITVFIGRLQTADCRHGVGKFVDRGGTTMVMVAN